MADRILQNFVGGRYVDTVDGRTASLIDPSTGEVFAEALLSRGGAVDPMEAYRAFRGRDPEIAPLVARRGLAG